METSCKSPLVLISRKATPFGAGLDANTGKPGDISWHSERFPLVKGYLSKAASSQAVTTLWEKDASCDSL